MRFVFAVIVAVMTTMGSSTWGYEESSVTDGGQLVGTVALDGQVPKPKGYNLITLPDQIYCGRISDGQGWRLLQLFNVGSAGQFRDVVVYLENVEKGKSFEKPDGNYTRYSISDDALSHLVPTLMRQER